MRDTKILFICCSSPVYQKDKSKNFNQKMMVRSFFKNPIKLIYSSHSDLRFRSLKKVQSNFSKKLHLRFLSLVSIDLFF